MSRYSYPYYEPTTATWDRHEDFSGLGQCHMVYYVNTQCGHGCTTSLENSLQRCYVHSRVEHASCKDHSLIYKSTTACHIRDITRKLGIPDREAEIMENGPLAGPSSRGDTPDVWWGFRKLRYHYPSLDELNKDRNPHERLDEAVIKLWGENFKKAYLTWDSHYEKWQQQSLDKGGFPQYTAGCHMDWNMKLKRPILVSRYSRGWGCVFPKTGEKDIVAEVFTFDM